MIERYFIPIAPYLFTTAGLIICTYIFCSLEREVQKLRAKMRQRDALLDAASNDMLGQIAAMRAELRDAEERTAQLVPPPPAKSGLNLNTRTQVLRMFRHGEGTEKIASKLGLPKNEVSLVLKVHKLAIDGPSFRVVEQQLTSS